jgi:hypothetical protein
VTAKERVRAVYPDAKAVKMGAYWRISLNGSTWGQTGVTQAYAWQRTADVWIKPTVSAPSPVEPNDG